MVKSISFLLTEAAKAVWMLMTQPSAEERMIRRVLREELARVTVLIPNDPAELLALAEEDVEVWEGKE